MKIEDHVCSQELSKHLHNMGIKQKSLFYYYKDDHGIFLDFVTGRKNLNLDCLRRINTEQMWSAFTSSELGKMLPEKIFSKNEEYFYLRISKDINHEWEISYKDFKGNNIHHEFSKKETDAKAKMIIYILKNNFGEKP